MERFVYVYGAAVQGIQNFIFRTNELKDIIGASELVEQVCTKLFREQFLQNGKKVVMAAGNIKCVYFSDQECKKTVRLFPKKVMETAPGITISQAVISTTEKELENNFVSLMDRLEDKLRVQRNMPSKCYELGLMGMERSRKTGLPAIEYIKDEYIDEATSQKWAFSDNALLCKKSFGLDLKYKDIALDTKELIGENDWIAVVHADGNGLGEIVRQKSTNKETLNTFSEKLNEATCQASRNAFNSVWSSNEKKIPFRPVVLGGDDITMICKASLALEYVKEYLYNFEKETRDRLDIEGGLTACAGIAFIKSSYPFHYGYKLAETLCSQAKKVSKSVAEGQKAPSSLMFYKVQSSFIESYDRMVEKEKTPDTGLSFDFGPYFLNKIENYRTIDWLEEKAKELSSKEGNRAKTAIRKWMSYMHQNQELAEQSAKRSEQILSNPSLRDVFKAATEKNLRPGTSTVFYAASDILDIYTICNQTTKEA